MNIVRWLLACFIGFLVLAILQSAIGHAAALVIGGFVAFIILKVWRKT